MECSRAIHEDRDWDHERPHRNFCRCPICKGFLPRYMPDDKPFKCGKCGTELMLFPATDSDGEEIPWESKICPISQDKHKKR